MTALTLELSPELFARLRAEAERLGKPIPAVVEDWLSERLITTPPLTERDRVRDALRKGGLLLEGPLDAELQRRVDSAALSLEQVSADLQRAGGRPLSEIILEQRGPKA